MVQNQEINPRRIFEEVNQLVAKSKAHRIGAEIGAACGIIGVSLIGPTIPAIFGTVSGLTLSGCMLGTMVAVKQAERRVAERRGISLEEVRQAWEEQDRLVLDPWVREIGQKGIEMMTRFDFRSGLKFLDRVQR